MPRFVLLFLFLLVITNELLCFTLLLLATDGRTFRNTSTAITKSIDRHKFEFVPHSL